MKKRLFILSILLSPFLLHAQTSTDVILLNMKVKKKGIEVSNARNITKRLGYDNQPHFHRTEPLIYYSSENQDRKMDIKAYTLNSNLNSAVTSTPENEFSPTLTPDGKHISCIIQRDNGKQDLGMYNLQSKEVTILIDELTVGYHAWIDKDNLLLFVLAENGNELQHYNLTNKQNKVLAKGIGRSLHKIPSQNAMSFINKSDNDQWQIERYDIKTGAITAIAPTLPKKEDITWTNNGIIISSDGDKLFYLKPDTAKLWQPIEVKSDTSLLKGITRLAVNPDNTKIAVVVSE
jgi:Tol biopolymer transport system component